MSPVGCLGFFAGPLPDGTLHADGGLLVQAVDDVHHLLVLHHHLGGAVEVPQHHKGEVLPTSRTFSIQPTIFTR